MVQRAAIIVVGGAGRRLGGVAKPWLLVGGRPIVDHVIDATRAHVDDIVLVGTVPAHARRRDDVRWTVEEPPGAGPAAAVRAGVALLDPGVDEVLLLAGDAPDVAATIEALCGRPLDGDGVVALVDDQPQFLLARLDRQSLVRALDQGGASMRSVFDHLQTHGVASHVLDADTWEDVVRLRAGSGAMTGNAWLDEAAQVLGIDAAIDIDAVLALTRDVAHGLERKYAPLTSYLLGYAAAARGLDAAAVAALAEELGRRAREHGSNG